LHCDVLKSEVLNGWA